MGMFNSWDYSTKEAETDATRRAALVEEFLDSDETHLLMLDETNKDKREDCADCIYPERKCSECINKTHEENEDGRK